MAAFGGRGTGKTAWVRSQIEAANPARLLVWDFKHDPALEGLGKPVYALPELIRACSAPRFALRFLPNHSADIHKQFDTLCQAAWLAGDLLLFVDELPEVTKANKAPPAWRRVVNIGREYRSSQGGPIKRISIIGAGQRPAECDKSFISNADVIHTGRLSNSADAQDLAKSIGCDPRALMALPDLHFMEKRAGDIGSRQGHLSFSGKKVRVHFAPSREAA